MLSELADIGGKHSDPSEIFRDIRCQFEIKSDSSKKRLSFYEILLDCESSEKPFGET